MGANKVKIYSILLTNHGKQLKTICSEKTEKKIYKRLDELMEENKKVVFPMQYNNHYHEMIEADYELVIIKTKQEGDSDITKIKNKYGEYIDYESNDKRWIIVDRVSYNIEETFWVYGYHPKIQRKTFQWVYDNMVANNAKEKYVFKTIQIYQNKVLIECDGKLDIVICKTKNDSIRFYNLLEEWCKKNKLKQILFMGDIRHSKYKNDWIKKIMELTNWNIKKVTRCSTRD